MKKKSVKQKDLTIAVLDEGLWDFAMDYGILRFGTLITIFLIASSFYFGEGFQWSDVIQGFATGFFWGIAMWYLLRWYHKTKNKKR